MKKPMKFKYLSLIFLAQAVIVFAAGYFLVIFGLALAALFLGVAIKEKWPKYQTPMNQTLFFWLSLLAIAGGSVLSALISPVLPLLGCQTVVIIGLITGVSLYSLGWAVAN